MIRDKKRQLGQYFTTNVDFILSNLGQYLAGKQVTDPFVGDGDLLNWALKHNCQSIKGYDIDIAYVDNKSTFLGNSIKSRRKYRFVLTNPPYLHKNKADSNLKIKYKGEYDEYEDLYQISIDSILNSEESIVIVPLNFLSADNSKKIRCKFFAKFEILELNLFTKPVFEDTTYNVIAFYFKKSLPKLKHHIKVNFVFENRSTSIELERRYDWEIGGEFLKSIRQIKNHLGIERLTYDNKNKHDINSNHLILTAIDTRKEKLHIKLKQEEGIEYYVGKQSSRNKAHIIFTRPISKSQQI